MSSPAPYTGRTLPVRAFGYDRSVVDELLREVEKALSSLAAERDDLRSKLEKIGPAADSYRNGERAIAQAVVAAEGMKADAKRQADLSEALAEQRATSLIADAHGVAAKIVADAERRASALEEVANGLEDRLRRFLTDLSAPVNRDAGNAPSRVDGLSREDVDVPS